MSLTHESTISLRNQLGKAIAGQNDVLLQIWVAILAGGHVLLEGVPGVAKTLMIRSYAKALDLDYRRIQFTPDLMPSDVVGTNVFNAKNSDFELRTGPIFANIVLADEINRTPPKTQAALLEAMEERQVTIDGVRHVLPDPFVVFATQNPIEFEGTYPLPEAQQDRFLMKIKVDYPTAEAELAVLRKFHMGFRSQDLDAVGIEPIITGDLLNGMRAEVNAIQVGDDVLQYIYKIVATTRDWADLQIGASPRAGLALLSCAKAMAAIEGMPYVNPDHIKKLITPVLSHRVLLRPDVDTQGFTVEEVLADLSASIPVPR